MIRFTGFLKSPSAPKPAPAPLPEAEQQARDLVSLFQRESGQHKLMEHNVACYLAHLREVGVTLPGAQMKTRAAALETISSATQAAGHAKNSSSHLELLEKLRWFSKLQREIRSPYNDAQVEERLGRCCKDLKDVLPNFSHIPHQLYLVGGPLAGGEARFGAHSDLDVVMAVPPEQRAEVDRLALQLAPDRRAQKDTVQLYITSTTQLPELLEHFGSHVTLASADPRSEVRRAVHEGLQSPGHIRHRLKAFPRHLATFFKL